MKFRISILAAVLAALPCAASAQTAVPESVLTVDGDGLVSRSADEARVSMEIVTNDDAATHSGGKNTAVYDALMARLATLGIPPGDVHTTAYNVTFVPYPPKDLPPEQRQPRYGYVTSRSLSVEVTPLENAGKVVDAATASGVTQIGDVSFELKDRRGAYLAALAAAMNDARESAAAIAAAGGFHIIRIRSVTAASAQPIAPYPMAMKRAAFAPGAAEPPTDITPNGPIEVTAHVSVTYDIH
jgi:uncharacterized protein YggE